MCKWIGPTIWKRGMKTVFYEDDHNREPPLFVTDVNSPKMSRTWKFILDDMEKKVLGRLWSDNRLEISCQRFQLFAETRWVLVSILAIVIFVILS